MTQYYLFLSLLKTLHVVSLSCPPSDSNSNRLTEFWLLQSYIRPASERSYASPVILDHIVGLLVVDEVDLDAVWRRHAGHSIDELFIIGPTAYGTVGVLTEPHGLFSPDRQSCEHVTITDDKVVT